MYDKPCQYILHLVRLKMKPNKQYIRYYLLFSFHQKKSVANAHSFCETYDEKCYSY